MEGGKREDVDQLDLGPFGDASLKVRLSNYVELPNCIAAMARNPKVLLINLFQTPYMFGASRWAPALLQRSQLYDLVRGRELLPAEHLLIQGFPVPGLVSNDLSKYFPFPGIFTLKYVGCWDDFGTGVDHPGGLDCHELRSISGIGFNWPSIGSMILFMMSCSRLAESAFWVSPDGVLVESPSRADEFK